MARPPRVVDRQLLLRVWPSAWGRHGVHRHMPHLRRVICFHGPYHTLLRRRKARAGVAAAAAPVRRRPFRRQRIFQLPLLRLPGSRSAERWQPRPCSGHAWKGVGGRQRRRCPCCPGENRYGTGMEELSQVPATRKRYLLSLILPPFPPSECFVYRATVLLVWVLSVRPSAHSFSATYSNRSDPWTYNRNRLELITATSAYAAF